MSENQNTYCDIRQNRETMSRLLPLAESFDLVQRDIRIGGR
jgi:hypothetical protein